MLVQQIGEVRGKAEHLTIVVMVDLDRMRKIEIGLRVPRGAAVLGVADGDRPGRGVCRCVNLLASAKNVGRLDGVGYEAWARISQVNI